MSLFLSLSHLFVFLLPVFVNCFSFSLFVLLVCFFVFVNCAFPFRCVFRRFILWCLDLSNNISKGPLPSQRQGRRRNTELVHRTHREIQWVCMLHQCTDKTKSLWMFPLYLYVYVHSNVRYSFQKEDVTSKRIGYPKVYFTEYLCV